MSRIASFARGLRVHAPTILTWAIIATTFAIAYLAMLRTMPIYTPDSAFYLGKALWFAGASQEDARAQVAAFAESFNTKRPPQVEQMFDWGLVQPRVVLPALAVPFIWVFGPLGLAVTTGLLHVGLVVTLTLIMIRRYGNLVAVATMLLLNASMYLMWFNSAMLTESTTGILAALTLVAGWRYLRRPSTWMLLAMAGLTVAAAFTRQATLITAGAFVMAWLLDMLVTRSWKSTWMWPAVVVGATSVAVQVLQTLLFAPFSQIDQFIAQSGADSLAGALLAIPRMAWRILSDDVKSLLADDVALLFLIGLAVASMLIFWRRSESHLLFGALLGIALYNVSNGSSTTFRYSMPGLVFFVVAAALLLSATVAGLGRESDNRASKIPAKIRRTRAASGADLDQARRDSNASMTRPAANPSP